MPRRALVTGAQGFIGSRLVAALLERGDEVVAWDLPGSSPGPAPGLPSARGLELAGVIDSVEFVEADISARDSVDRAFAGVGEVDVVFHLAARTLVGEAASDPEGTYRANIAGTWHLLEAARRAGVGRVIVASSDKAYGPSAELPYREEQPLRPASPYEASKAACDVIARSYAPMYGLPVAVTRFANVYGGGDLNPSRLIPGLIVSGLVGEAAVVRSDGSPMRDFMHISDAIAAYLAIDGLLEDGGGHGLAFNAGSGAAVSVGDVVDAIGRHLPGFRPEFHGEGNPDGEIDRQYVDPSRLRSMTGWCARIPLEEGIAEAIAWYRENLKTG